MNTNRIESAEGWYGCEDGMYMHKSADLKD